MVKEGLNFWVEQSGRYLLCDYTTSSDALINALFLCKIYREKGSLLQYASPCVEITSVSKNIPLTESNIALCDGDRLQNTAGRVSQLYPDCRLVLHKGGTESWVVPKAKGTQYQKGVVW